MRAAGSKVRERARPWACPPQRQPAVAPATNAGTESFCREGAYLGGVVELLQGVSGAFPTAAVHHKGIPPHDCKDTGDTNKNHQFLPPDGASTNHPQI